MKKIKLNDAAYKDIQNQIDDISKCTDDERSVISKRFQEVFSNLKVYPDQNIVEVCDADFEYLKNFLDWSESLSKIIRENSTQIEDSVKYPPLVYEVL